MNSQFFDDRWKNLGLARRANPVVEDHFDGRFVVAVTAVTAAAAALECLLCDRSKSTRRGNC